jgi:hypothetical protein
MICFYISDEVLINPEPLLKEPNMMEIETNQTEEGTGERVGGEVQNKIYHNSVDTTRKVS